MSPRDKMFSRWGPAPNATRVLGHRPVITWHVSTCISQSYVCCLIAVLHDMQSIVVSSLFWRDSHSLSHMPTMANSSRAIIIGIPQVICHHNIKLHVSSVVSLGSCHLLLGMFRQSFWMWHHSKVIDHRGPLLTVYLQVSTLIVGYHHRHIGGGEHYVIA